MIFLSVIGFTSLVVMFWFLWRHRHHRFSIIEILDQCVSKLSLKEVKIGRYPHPTLVGHYFGFRLSLEGMLRKEPHEKTKVFRFFIHLEWETPIQNRLFLQSERIPAKFKPIAGLKWVATNHSDFDQNFLLMSSDPSFAQLIFQSYFCEKLLSLSERHWKLDISGKEAHGELWQSQLHVEKLTEVLKAWVEFLNAYIIKGL